MTTEELLLEAIQNKKALAIDYNDHIRLVAPIRYGWKTTERKGRHKNLFCYQFGGHNPRPLGPEGSIANYRCWNADMIRSALPIRDPWRASVDWSSRRSQCIEEVIAEVSA